MNSLQFAFRFKNALSVVAVALLVSGCLRSKGVLRGSIFETRDTRYQIGDLPETWERMSLRGADLAYVNEKTGSTLLINSMCSSENDAPLIALTFHLLIGMTEQTVLDQKVVSKSNREGLETIATAKLDGVIRKFKMFVLKKDYCLYDIVFSASLEKFDQDLLAYENAVKGFDVPGEHL